MYLLPETELMKTSVESDKQKGATFTIEPLSPGYGVTLGNSLRRVMLSSLEGSAVSSVKIDGVSHEFSSLENMREDIVNFVLNLKGLPVRLHGDEAATITIDVKGPKKVTAGDIALSSQVEIIDPTYELATLEKSGKLKAEITIEKGRGFVPTEKRIDEKVSLGTILVDSIFTPIKKIHYDVVNTRVGSVTNFDKLTMDVTTNGSITPEEAMKRACQILNDHFTLVNEAITVKELKKAVTKKVKVAPKIKKIARETKTKKAVSKAKK